MPNRLFVSRLTSIGLVDKPDNPESTVVIFKAREFETGQEFEDRINARFKRMDEKLADLTRRLAAIRSRRKRDLERTQGQHLEGTPDPDIVAGLKKRNTMTDQTTGQMIKAKLDAHARKLQYDGAIAGTYGYLSTPTDEMVLKIKVKWWDTDDGRAVKALDRENGADPADKIAKGHSEAYAALGRLQG